jgi:HAD superfamily hydrolase (TIGR01450 family)
MESPPRPITAAELIDRYELLLLDAYGVLVHAGGAMPGAVELLEAVSAAGKRYLVVTNDASRLPETAADRLRGMGLAVDVDQIVCSGMLLAPRFAAGDLAGARCLVLGPADSIEYVRRAGGVVEDCAEDGEYDAIVVCDDAGYPFLGTLDTAVTALFRLVERGRAPRLILPNPDIIYNRGPNSFGFTAGAAAMLLEVALERRFPGLGLRFERLGKPHRPLFELALERGGGGPAVMIGDQLETDIAGAVAAGIDSALLAGGVAGDTLPESPVARPTYLLASLATTTRVR